MVDLIRVDAKKIDLKANNQILNGLKEYILSTTTVYDEKLTSPNLVIPFDYNIFILVVDYAYMVCPTPFIVNISKYRGTSVY